jgi:phospholipid/cholesterol/gamma-HCH transport system permease protein
MLPLLTVVADAMGIIGGLLIAVFQEGLTASFYFTRVFRSLGFNDLLLGFTKPAVFAFIIAIIGCHNGLRTRGGADGVGRSTTNTVYAASIAILIADFFFTKLVIGLAP